MPTVLIVILLLLEVAIVGVGIYLAAYLKSKAKNLATREEFKELQRQTAELTRTTAQIDTDIKGGLWDRQKRWELKRDVLFEAARRIAAVFDALKNLDNILQTELKNPSVKNLTWTQMSIDENKNWFKAKSALDESRLFIGVTCGTNVADVIDRYGHLTTTVAANINKNDGDIFKKSTSQLSSLNEAIRDAIRKELAIEKGAGGEVKSLSTVSSATSTPAAPDPAAK